MEKEKRNKRLVIIGGVRPQFIKMAALQWAISNFNLSSETKIEAIFINSGQHYDDGLSETLIRDLKVRIDFSFTYESKDPISITGNMFIKLSELLDGLDPKPDCVVVMGDATTTFVSAVVGARKGFPVVHIEAGVRSGDIRSIEELHRRVVSHIASVHFCTSQSGVSNLALENIKTNVYWTGDIAYDYFIDYSNKQRSGIGVPNNGEYILATLHKPINVNSEETLLSVVRTLANYRRDIIFITHPRTKEKLNQLGLLNTNGIIYMDPLPYSTMISAIKGSAFLLTDSGGLQREAYYLRKRCLVRRDSLGWLSLIEAGANRLIGSDEKSILDGLEWVEEKLKTNSFPNIDNEFIREKSWEYALSLLIEKI